MPLAHDDIRSEMRRLRRGNHRWRPSASSEMQYAARLRQVATQVNALLRGYFALGHDPSAELAAQAAAQLQAYADILPRWAAAVAQWILRDIDRRSARAWFRRGEEVGRRLRHEVAEAPIGPVLREAMERQITLITSLPRDAAQRVQSLALTGYARGRRPGEIRSLEPSALGPFEAVPDGLAKEILRTGEVTASRANLIARTETTRVATELTKARAEHIGSNAFIWRAVMDADTRHRHRELNGNVFHWADPPVAGENGEHYLPGCGPNCRCYAEPVLPDLI